MNAPAAPLTPADIDALLPEADGWNRHEGCGIWTRHDPYRYVALDHVCLAVVVPAAGEIAGQTQAVWRIPSPTMLDALYVLTRCGLIPGQVSVTQPRVWNEGDPEPTDAKAVTDTGGERWEPSNSPGYWENTDRVTGYWSSLPWDRLAEILSPLTEVVDR